MVGSASDSDSDDAIDDASFALASSASAAAAAVADAGVIDASLMLMLHGSMCSSLIDGIALLMPLVELALPLVFCLQ